MNWISQLDNLLYSILYKLRIKCDFYSYEQLILRYVRRDTQKLHPERYYSSTPTELSRRAWTFWAQGEDNLPPILKQCYESIKRNSGEYQLTFITLENINQFVEIPECVKQKVEKGQISLTHFSDFLRVSLLNKWGGFWVDITLFLSRPLPNINSLFTVKHQFDDRHVSRCQWTGFLWYMPQGHPLAQFLYDYLIYYWQHHDKVVDYLLLDYAIRVFYEKNKTFAAEIDKLPFSNQNLYFFQSKESETEFSFDRWRQVCSETSFFKTTWKHQFQDKCNGKITFYGKLLNNSSNLSVLL